MSNLSYKQIKIRDYMSIQTAIINELYNSPLSDESTKARLSDLQTITDCINHLNKVSA
jgi:hypothetical protein